MQRSFSGRILAGTSRVKSKDNKLNKNCYYDNQFAIVYSGFQVGPTFPIFPTFLYFFDLLLLFPTFS